MKRRAIYISLIGCIGLFLAITGRAEETPADKGKVLAKVNGVPIHMTDVIDPASLKNIPEDKRAKTITILLDSKIDEELLFQEAKKRGLADDKEFRKELQRNARTEKETRLTLLANAYEQQIESLIIAKDPSTISDKDFDAAFKTFKAGFSGRKPDKFKDSIRRRLVNKRHTVAYNKWLKTVAPKILVSVNGRAIPPEVITAAIDHGHSPTGDGFTPQPNVVAPMWRAVTDAIGVDAGKLLTQKTAEGGAKPERWKDKLVPVIFKIADQTYKWSESPTLLGLADLTHSDETAADTRHLTKRALFQYVKVRIVAEIARRNGADKNPDVQKLIESGGIMGMIGTMSDEKQILVRLLKTRVAAAEAEANAVTEVEVNQYYEDNKKQYSKHISRPGGEAKVFDLIRRILESKRRIENDESFVESLAKAGKVERFDTD